MQEARAPFQKPVLHPFITRNVPLNSMLCLHFNIFTKLTPDKMITAFNFFFRGDGVEGVVLVNVKSYSALKCVSRVLCCLSEMFGVVTPPPTPLPQFYKILDPPLREVMRLVARVTPSL